MPSLLCPRLARPLAAVLVPAALVAPAWADQIVNGSSALLPDSVFAQAAYGEGTHAATVGLQWHPPWHWHPTRHSRVGLYLELEFGRWRAEFDGGGSAWSWVSQFSLVPVLRWSGPADEGWYLEIGVGPSYLTPVYRSATKRFSSQFQFRDHLGIGRTFGQHGRHDLSLRIQHFSNAGIERPNPGLNMVGLRYSWRF
jgi:lipid A 3-O-deacylase